MYVGDETRGDCYHFLLEVQYLGEYVHDLLSQATYKSKYTYIVF